MKKISRKKRFAAIVAAFCLIPLLFGCSPKTNTSGDKKQDLGPRPTVNPEDPMVVQFNTIDKYFDEPRNIILMIGDGMGPNQVKLSAELSGGNYEGKAYMQCLPNQGFAMTNSLDGLTDSAAAATALATGYKTGNGRVGKNQDGKDLKSLTELAKERGMRTGVISTKPATDATPAAFSAHVKTRGEQDRIAYQQLSNLPNVLIGAGLEYYSAAKKAVPSVKKTLQEMGVTQLTTLEELEQAPTDTEYLLCTTASETDICLSTQKALELLNKDDNKGFFLMIEGAKIDTYGHANSMSGVMKEFQDFDKAVGIVMEFMIKNPDTLLIVTADHETGGLMDQGGGDYYFTTGSHSNADVPIFAAGAGTEIFNEATVENTEIAKFLAKKMGELNFGQ